LHKASPSRRAERAILTSIVDALTSGPDQIQNVIELVIGWEGASRNGMVFVQRFKHAGDRQNREQLWEVFHTCIHEYLHTLAHPAFDTYADRLGEAKDEAREDTLAEGFCDFFADNVRAALVIDEALQQQIEGPYFKAEIAPPANPVIDRYDSSREAERVVAIVGIKNAQAAYFQGRIELIVDRNATAAAKDDGSSIDTDDDSQSSQSSDSGDETEEPPSDEESCSH
jgi:hypothetical protein